MSSKLSSVNAAPLPPWGSAVAGATGAVLANALVYPLDMYVLQPSPATPLTSTSVKTRLQTQVKRKGDQQSLAANHVHYKSTMHAIQHILEDEGLTGLYSGISGSLLGVASTNFAYFYWYSVVRTLYTKYQTIPGPPSTAVELSLGAVAGAIAQLFTIPVAVITTRQQTQPKGDKKGLIDTGREVVHGEDGWTGLWRGLKASLVLVVNPAITYGAYQRLREIMYPGKVALKPHQAFLLGALSKSLATIVTQPLIVAKVGLQSRPPPARQGKPFKSFTEVMGYVVEHEGILGLFKGISPQLLKGLLVQGLLMMTKERMELLFVLLFAYVRMTRERRLRAAADRLRSTTAPYIDAASEKVKGLLPVSVK